MLFRNSGSGLLVQVVFCRCFGLVSSEPGSLSLGCWPMVAVPLEFIVAVEIT